MKILPGHWSRLQRTQTSDTSQLLHAKSRIFTNAPEIQSFYSIHHQNKRLPNRTSQLIKTTGTYSRAWGRAPTFPRTGHGRRFRRSWHSRRILTPVKTSSEMAPIGWGYRIPFTTKFLFTSIKGSNSRFNRHLMGNLQHGDHTNPDRAWKKLNCISQHSTTCSIKVTFSLLPGEEIVEYHDRAERLRIEYARRKPWKCTTMWRLRQTHSTSFIERWIDDGWMSSTSISSLVEVIHPCCFVEERIVGT